MPFSRFAPRKVAEVIPVVAALLLSPASSGHQLGGLYALRTDGRISLLTCWLGHANLLALFAGLLPSEQKTSVGSMALFQCVHAIGPDLFMGLFLLFRVNVVFVSIILPVSQMVQPPLGLKVLGYGIGIWFILRSVCFLCRKQQNTSAHLFDDYTVQSKLAT